REREREREREKEWQFFFHRQFSVYAKYEKEGERARKNSSFFPQEVLCICHITERARERERESVRESKRERVRERARDREKRKTSRSCCRPVFLCSMGCVACCCVLR